MSWNRRDFLALCGLSFLGTAGGFKLIAPGEHRKFAGEGPRFAMAVDLVACKTHQAQCGRACITACHRAHNVPSIPDKRHEIKWIWMEDMESAFAGSELEEIPSYLEGAPVILLCNHCEHPPCTKVCPTQATWKREDGVVMMDWHRCIGCRYCMAACPYGSRSFNWEDPRRYLSDPDPNFPTRTRGVVEKCDFCEERLAEGKPPACVEACRYGAITFGDLSDPNSEISRKLDERFSIRRKATLGTGPHIYYLV